MIDEMHFARHDNRGDAMRISGSCRTRIDHGDDAMATIEFLEQKY
jgi:hypothetical protein